MLHVSALHHFPPVYNTSSTVRLKQSLSLFVLMRGVRKAEMDVTSMYKENSVCLQDMDISDILSVRELLISYLAKVFFQFWVSVADRASDHICVCLPYRKADTPTIG